VTFRADFSLCGDRLALAPPEGLAREIERTGAAQAEVRILDPRCHTPEQHGKVFALCKEIARWSGHCKAELIDWAWTSPEDARHGLTDDFCAKRGLPKFSMADADMTTCSEFIGYLVDFCLANGVATSYPIGHYADDMEACIVACLTYRKCILCGREADIHHVKAIGMGFDRSRVIHIGMPALPLCRKHHAEAHQAGVDTFLERTHLLPGVKLTEGLCRRLGLKYH
jgi:hypothetical protein